jgi:hypothetical protein
MEAGVLKFEIMKTLVKLFCHIFFYLIMFRAKNKHHVNVVLLKIAGHQSQSDLVISLPTDSISLYGSDSNDPDGKISEWLCKKFQGPLLFYNIICYMHTAPHPIRLEAGVSKF